MLWPISHTPTIKIRLKQHSRNPRSASADGAAGFWMNRDGVSSLPRHCCPTPHTASVCHVCTQSFPSMPSKSSLNCSTRRLERCLHISFSIIATGILLVAIWKSAAEYRRRWQRASESACTGQTSKKAMTGKAGRRKTQQSGKPAYRIAVSSLSFRAHGRIAANCAGRRKSYRG